MIDRLLDKDRLTDDLAWGVLMGVFGGLYLCIFAVVAYTLEGPTLFAEYEVTFRQVIEVYLTASVIGGLLVGFFRPIVHLTAGGALVGFLVTFVLYGAIGLTMGGESPKTWFIITLICATLVGIPVGIYHVRENRREERGAARPNKR